MFTYCSLIRSLMAMMFIALMAPSMGLARWATFEEASVAFESYNRDTLILANGKSEETIEQRVKIINESGRNEYGIQRLYYVGNIQHVDIIEAKTIHEGKEYPVDIKSIERKPLASDGSGFDQIIQVIVSFRQVMPGSVLVFKYKITTDKQPLPKYYSTDFIFGREGVWHKSRVSIKSELPLHLKVNDPQKVLEVKETKDKQYHNIDISLKGEFYQSGINEPNYSHIPYEQRTWATISTTDKFEDLSKELSPNFTKVIAQALPPMMDAIKKIAEQHQDPIAQINQVTSSLSEKVRYMGDWRSIEGRYAPRSLNVIADSGYGDCKDYCSATAAILKALGYNVQVAMVNRDDSYLPPQNPLPNLSLFNHVILKVTLKDGKVLWIDPTNTISMADGLFPDIANRPALLLDDNHPTYETIPNIDYKHARFESENILEIKSNALLHTQGTVKLFGEKDLLLTAATLSNSAQAVGESLIHNLSGESTPVSQNVQLPDLSSRIAKDISFTYGYEQENAVLLTNNGDGIFLDSAWVDAYLNTSADQVGTIFIGHPSTLKRKLIFKDVHVENLSNLNYQIKTPWVEAHRECRLMDGGIEVEEHVAILKSFLSAEETKTPAYKEFKNQLKKYCTKVAVIVTPKGQK